MVHLNQNINQKKKLISLKQSYFTYLFIKSNFGKKIISYFIKCGKKQFAEYIICKLLQNLQKKNKNTLIFFKKTLLNILPFYEIRKYTIRGIARPSTLLIYNKKRRLFLLFQSILKILKKEKLSIHKKLLRTWKQTYKKEGIIFQNFKNSQELALKQYPSFHYRWN